MKLMVIWTGAVVPSYQGLFEALSKNSSLVVIAPKKWRHGPLDIPCTSHDDSYTLISTPFLFSHSAHYLIPALPLLLRKFSPAYVYIMDELDRASLVLHGLLIRCVLPRAKLFSYSLQNILHPSYYKGYHRISIKINTILVHGVIAASKAAEEVLHSHNYGNKTAVIPLGASPDFFNPGDKPALRLKHGIPQKKTVIIFAGSLSPEKGVEFLASQMPDGDKLLLLVAGDGPLFNALMTYPKNRVRLLGALAGEKLREFYQLADYVILPSQTSLYWKEQIGRSLLEGILCGCVALGSDSGYIPAITLMKETIFKQNDSMSLRTLLEKLPFPNHEALYDAQITQVKNRFLWKIIARQTLAFFQGACN